MQNAMITAVDESLYDVEDEDLDESQIRKMYSSFSFDNARESGINLLRDYIWSNKDKIKQHKFEQFVLVIVFDIAHEVNGWPRNHDIDSLHFPFVLNLEDVGDISQNEWYQRFAKLTNVLDDCIICAKKDENLFPQTLVVKQQNIRKECEGWWSKNISKNWDVETNTNVELYNV